jgi:tetratricopeptide (TPR) repeat protein
MKRILIAPLLVMAFMFPAAAQETGTSAQLDAQKVQRTPTEKAVAEELNQAAHSYRLGNYVEAQQHSEKALVLDPSNKTAPSFIARTIHAQYNPGVQSEENAAKAREAIDAYKRILVQDPLNDETYKAIAYLYEALKDTEQHRQWVFQRALNPIFPADKRAEAYVVLASKDWDCSFVITELPTNKTMIDLKRGSPKIRYSKPKDVAEFEKAHRCAENGLTMSEAAIALAPDNEAAWSYKANVLLELVKLAEMDENSILKTDYERQLVAASSVVEELTNRRESKLPAKP